LIGDVGDRCGRRKKQKTLNEASHTRQPPSPSQPCEKRIEVFLLIRIAGSQLFWLEQHPNLEKCIDARTPISDFIEVAVGFCAYHFGVEPRTHGTQLVLPVGERRSSSLWAREGRIQELRAK